MEKPVPSSPTEPTLSIRHSPQERLAASRKALVRHMARDASPRTLADTTLAADARHPDTSDADSVDATPSHRGGFSSNALRMLRRALRTWWRHHPAHLAVSVAEPVLKRYAHQSPFRLLAISAAVGAAVVVTKPWRLVSVGAIALATLKSSEFSGLVVSLLSSQTDDSETSA